MPLSDTREDLPHLDVTWPLDRVLGAAAAASARHWLPLCHGGIDHLMGAVSPREVVAAKASGSRLAELALPVWFAPDPRLTGGNETDTGAGLHCPLVVYVDEDGLATGIAERDDAA